MASIESNYKAKGKLFKINPLNPNYPNEEKTARCIDVFYDEFTEMDVLIFDDYDADGKYMKMNIIYDKLPRNYSVIDEEKFSPIAVGNKYRYKNPSESNIDENFVLTVMFVSPTPTRDGSIPVLSRADNSNTGERIYWSYTDVRMRELLKDAEY